MNVSENGNERVIEGVGTGAIDGCVAALNEAFELNLQVRDYAEHSLGEGADASAIAYMDLAAGNHTLFGAGIDRNTVAAALKALVSGANRVLTRDV